MSYMVECENLPEASAYARLVTISDPFDPGLDIRTFRLGQIVFNNRTVTVPPNRSYFQTRVPMEDQGSNIVVDISAGVDLNQRRVFWTFTAIDLNTGELPLGVDKGVLPPNTTNQIGQGYVTYTVKPLASLPSGTLITNGARIIFDDNEPIDTRVVTNIVDSLAPTSAVLSLPPVMLTSSFEVAWSGQDETNGSGLYNFDVYYKEDGGGLVLWQGITTNRSGLFTGQPGKTYEFYSRARDNAGNLEAPHGIPDATTTISGNVAPALVGIGDQIAPVQSGLCFTNVITDTDPESVFTAMLLNAPAGASATVMDGTNVVVCWTPTLMQGGTTNLLELVISDNGVPSMSSTQTFIVTVPDFVEVSLGSASVAPGETACLPVNLGSSGDLTNLQALLSVPAGAVAEASLQVAASDICVGSVQSLSPTELLLNLDICPGQSLEAGQRQVGILCLAVTNGSGSVAIDPVQVTGWRQDGAAVAGVAGLPGVVTVVGSDTVWLEGQLGTNGLHLLTLHGVEGDRYGIQYATNLITPDWKRLPYEVTLTNGVTQLLGLQPAPELVFYRAVKIEVPTFTDPPQLEVRMNPDGSRQLTIYGRVGFSCSIEYSTNLTEATWTELTRLTLTNDVVSFSTTTPEAGMAFYRLVYNDPPRLDFALAPDGSRQLTVYGRAGYTYFIQYTTSLSDPDWIDLTRITMTNSVVHLTTHVPEEGMAFYRVVYADPPRMDISAESDGSRKLVVYGEPGSTYLVQYTTTLSSPNWLTLSNLTLATSTAVIDVVSPPGQMAFYRVLKFEVVESPAGLEALVSTNGLRLLRLTGTPGSTHYVEYTTNLTSASSWTRLPRLLGLTDSPLTIRRDLPTGDVFYRAVQFHSESPQLELSMNPDGSQRLVLFGKPGGNYRIQYTSSLSEPDWTDLRQVSFVQNSFVELTVNTSSGFYRVLEF